MDEYAALAMYPLEPIRPAWERLWTGVHARLGWTPPSLTWTEDVQTTWTDPRCVVAQACGWPVATSLRDVVDVVGAFALDLPEAQGHQYRAAIMSSRPDPLDSLVSATSVAAANSHDSLSGWISLRAATVGGADWPGSVVWTAAHVESLRAVQTGRADVASIDPLSLAYVRRHRPDLVDGLHVVGRGPLVPSPAIVVPAGTPPDRIAELRAALIAVVTDPTVGARTDLHLSGFVALDHVAYESLLGLTGSR